MVAGEVGDPIRLGGVWLLMKLEDRRPADVPDFERARPVLRRLMLIEQMQQKAAALSAAVRLDAGLPAGAAQ
jgi:parvulin-like peptidyl-prolyl isomerase